VAAARQFADRVGDTVVVVLADHETSGFSIIGALKGGIGNLQSLPADAAKVEPRSEAGASEGRWGVLERQVPRAPH
jgi:alkaline phosphatase